MTEPVTDHELFPVLWDDRTGQTSPQRHLCQVDEPTAADGPTFLLCDGTPTHLAKVMGPVSFEEGVALAERLLRDGILSESDMARALAVCMVLVGVTRPVPPEDRPFRLMHVPAALRARQNAPKPPVSEAA